MILLVGTGWVLLAVLLAWALLGHPRRVPADGRATPRWLLAAAFITWRRLRRTTPGQV